MPDAARAASDLQAPPQPADDTGPARATSLPHRLSVVVPMYNEVENVVPLLEAVHGAPRRIPLALGAGGGRRRQPRRHRDPRSERHAAPSSAPHVRVVRLLRNYRPDRRRCRPASTRPAAT